VKLATVAVFVGLVLVPSATAADGKLTFRGFGTAVVDGDVAPGEWDHAGRYTFQANRSPAEGGGSVPATFCVMNDATNLYLALRVSVQNFGYSTFDSIFQAPGPNPFVQGSDILRALPTYFEDLHFHQTSPFEWSWLADVADGGTQDGTLTSQTHSGFIVYELAHPLNTADDLHDFSLTIPTRVTFAASFEHCLSGSCAATTITPTGFADLVVVSGTFVPPNTRITSGPSDGAEVRDERTFEFTGTDDVTPADQLEFACRVDGGDWTACESPFGGVLAEGWHTLRVRAVDEMRNFDTTPARRRWRIDTRAPSKPTVRMRNGAYRFSAKDQGTLPRRLKFRCGLDTRRLHACGPRFRLRSAGRHVLRVRAVDPAGNESAVRVLRVQR
jgi:hypothetical protein